MSAHRGRRPQAAAAGRARGVRRLPDAWRALAPEQRLCGIAAMALFATMLLPWYSTSSPARLGPRVVLAKDTRTALEAFSFVEAAVLLVALGVLALLFARGERRPFHLPGGDGTVIAAAGAWAALLIVWRLFDKPELGQGVSVGLAWGIFVALGVALALAAAGNRLRAARRPEPPLPERPPPAPRGDPDEIRLPDERPHLAPTAVLPEGRTRRLDRPPPLSRATAAQDTAELRAAAPPSDSGPGEDSSPHGGAGAGNGGDEGGGAGGGGEERRTREAGGGGEERRTRETGDDEDEPRRTRQGGEDEARRADGDADGQPPLPGMSA